MLTRSISRTDAAPTPTETVVARIFFASRSRSTEDKRFESSTPRIARRPGGMTTAHATTGPARGPRPTSSIPAMCGPSWPRSSRSMALQRATISARRGRLRNHHANLLLFDSTRLTRQLAQIEELRATHPTATNHRDICQHRAVCREDALHSNAIRDFPDSEGGADAAAAASDTHALERLHTLLVSLTNTDVHLEGVAGAKRGQRFQPLFFCFDERMHMCRATCPDGVGFGGTREYKRRGREKAAWSLSLQPWLA